MDILDSGPQRAESPGPPITFWELARDWLDTESGALVCPDNERRHVEHLYTLWDLTERELRPRIVKITLCELSTKLSAATVNKIRGTGRKIIREAQLNDLWFGPNPFDVVRRFREVRPQHRVLSLNECRAVLPHLREDRRLEVLMMLYLGMRPGELKALRKDDLDLAAGCVLIRRSNGRNKTKTGKQRSVPIPDGLQPHLEAAMARSESALLFPGEGGKLQRFDAKLTRALKWALKKAGLVSGYEHICRRCGFREERRTNEKSRCPACNKMCLWVEGIALPVRYYDLRHSSATLHREAGADPLAIQIALGHAPESLTDSLYTHLPMSYLHRELSKLQI